MDAHRSIYIVRTFDGGCSRRYSNRKLTIP
ncbi:flavodoxin domain protein, partial [Vibrio parahaemolyticus EKP-028]